jgi:glycosyltransferase involved in cell wall biosynthesis
MTDMTRDEIKRLVRDVFAEMTSAEATTAQKSGRASQEKGPRVLVVFNAGVRKLEIALEEVRLIEEAAGKSGIFTGDSARAWVCGEDVRGKIGARCILDTVKAEGLEKVLERADVLVLPTLCLKVAGKVANLTCDDQESGIVLSALLQGKKVLAADDGFLVCDILVNEKIREGIDYILKRLMDFGVVFCPTDLLNITFRKLAADEESRGSADKRPSGGEESESPLRLITAKAITQAVDNKMASIQLAPGGRVTPLARDLAKEYAIKIIET